MDYLYDVFVSYRRHPEWTPWTRNDVCRLLDAYLTQEMPSAPRIFVDEKIDPGADWPHRLGESLARARVVVAIFSGDYFRSEWCLHELDLIHARLQRFPGRTLIIPVLGHDGELVPKEIARFQPHDLKDFRNAHLQPKTPEYQKFADAVSRLAPAVAAAIASAPPFDPAWVAECEGRFDEVYEAHCGGPAIAVKTLTLKALPTAITPPRVIL